MDVFISHSRTDRSFADRLAKDLASEGLEVWIDSAALKPGDNWIEAVFAGIGSARVFIAILSENTESSPYFSAEVAAALAAAEISPERKIVPIVLDGHLDIPPFLKQFQAIDASAPEKLAAAVKLIAKLCHSSSTPVDAAKANEIAAFRRVLQTVETKHRDDLASQSAERENFLIGRLFGILAISIFVAATGVTLAYNRTYSHAVFENVDIGAFLLFGAVSILASYIAGFSAAKRMPGHSHR